MQKAYKQAKELIQKSARILIISHKKPDADTLGSAIALKIWLRTLGKDVVTACIDKPSEDFSFLPYLREFVSKFSLDDFDLIIFVDVGASYMSLFQLEHKDLFDKLPILNIDHHPSNQNYGHVNMVDAGSASTTVILYKFFRELGVDINEDIATCLLAGIYGDTGSFKHANTSSQTYEIAAYLMYQGAKIADVGKNLFKTKSVKTLRLWGKVLENAHFTKKNAVISVIREDDYLLSRSGPEQLSGVVEYLNMVPDAKYAILINEDRKGNIKGSFRTKNHDVDLAKIAENYGGGGHKMASGFCVPGRIEKKVNYEIILEDDDKKSLEF